MIIAVICIGLSLFYNNQLLGMEHLATLVKCTLKDPWAYSQPNKVIVPQFGEPNYRLSFPTKEELIKHREFLQRCSFPTPEELTKYCQLLQNEHKKRENSKQQNFLKKEVQSNPNDESKSNIS